MLQSIADAVLKPVRALVGNEVHPANSLAVAHAFIQDFQMNYCSEGEEEKDYPPFLPTKWRDVHNASRRDAKLMVIYLHSSMHDDTQIFCEQVLKDSGVLEFMHSDDILVWGADVKHRDGTQVAGFLKACAFPFMAMCMKHQNGSLLVLDRIEGIASLGSDENTSLGEKVLQRLQKAKTQPAVSSVQAVNRAENERREFRQRQDQEYQDTLRQDRERREQQERDEQQRRQQEEEEARLQEEEEAREALEEAIEMSRQLSFGQKIEQLKNELPEIPPKDLRKGVTKIKVRLGGGGQMMRSFYKETTIQSLRNWILVEMSERDINITNFRINCNMPKVSFGDDDTNDCDTLETTGLHPNAMLFVQDMDS